jgi:Ulp1 family protease
MKCCIATLCVESMQACDCVLDCDLLLFPVNYEGSHWAMAAVDLRPASMRLLYWDSLSWVSA